MISHHHAFPIQIRFVTTYLYIIKRRQLSEIEFQKCFRQPWKPNIHFSNLIVKINHIIFKLDTKINRLLKQSISLQSFNLGNVFNTVLWLERATFINIDILHQRQHAFSWQTICIVVQSNVQSLCDVKKTSLFLF